jgi:hypothetical protein
MAAAVERISMSVYYRGGNSCGGRTVSSISIQSENLLAIIQGVIDPDSPSNTTQLIPLHIYKKTPQGVADRASERITDTIAVSIVAAKSLQFSLRPSSSVEEEPMEDEDIGFSVHMNPPLNTFPFKEDRKFGIYIENKGDSFEATCAEVAPHRKSARARDDGKTGSADHTHINPDDLDTRSLRTMLANAHQKAHHIRYMYTPSAEIRLSPEERNVLIMAHQKLLEDIGLLDTALAKKIIDETAVANHV